MGPSQGYGAERVVRTINETLRSYLEAQYHIKDESLIEERRLILEDPGVIYQRPYVEATPVYQTVGSYETIPLPERVRRILADLSKLSPPVGIYPTPYTHQARGLERFFTEGKDLIIATGTGSGKTESFLMPILGSLALEAHERPDVAPLPGCRALVLYPMNALVNDQLGRIRRLFGDERVADLLRSGRGRPVRFGSYTGRTPYPGVRSATKDALHLRPIFEDFYLKYAGDEATIRQLKGKGRWPSKDLIGFYGADKVQQSTYKSGKKAGKPRRIHNWPMRLLTQQVDRELLTRHEMQIACPDILITNYSMLEYMLLRPIEREIFAQTRRWLAAHQDNRLILVLDEAHMYRGAAGAEVALLIRRLIARLGVPREKVRCILTSASLGEGRDAEEAVVSFACDLTGIPRRQSAQMALIKGDREGRTGRRPGTPEEAARIARLDLGAFQDHAIAPERALATVREVAGSLGWPAPPADPGALDQYIFTSLTGFGPAEELIALISGQAVELGRLSQSLFPGSESGLAMAATERLLAMGTFARRAFDDRVFLPSRLHLFYRGLPGLYACINRRCEARRAPAREGRPFLLGALHTEPRVECGCTPKARVFEVLTHRDCGSAFLKGFIRGADGDFLWHEPSRAVGSELSERLYEVHFLVEEAPHPTARETDVQEVWIEVTSGRMARTAPSESDRFLRVFAPNAPPRLVGVMNVLSFQRCPVCLRRWRGTQSKIMDLATKGEAPFANLVKAQVIHQPLRFEEGARFPNGGRKSLLFSDGRQKAARLARDIPREVERDSFRQAICLAAQRLAGLTGEARLTPKIYTAFVSVASDFHLHLFDGEDQRRLRDDVGRFNDFYGGNLAAALEDHWPSPASYSEALLRQLCSPFYSLTAATVGYVGPLKNVAERIAQELKEHLPGSFASEVENLALAWIAGLLDDMSFDGGLSASLRAQAAGYWKPDWGSAPDLPRRLASLLSDTWGLPPTSVSRIQETFCRYLASEVNGQWFIDPNRVALRVVPGGPWYQCLLCTSVTAFTIAGHCANCAETPVRRLEPDRSEYLRARKGFWRNPVVAAIEGRDKPRHITAEEHTAQLSQRDVGVVQATTEKYELRFQDVVIGKDDGPVDVLSCTTTMEVGVDIGSLVAVGLRNVPPQRENYQQRAGRAGRRGSAVSTVITYGQGGPHDSYYFHYPVEIVSGKPRKPIVKTDNAKIVRRHLHAFLFQTFFHETLDKHGGTLGAESVLINSSLGSTFDFFRGPRESAFSLHSFATWVKKWVLGGVSDLLESVAGWLPEGVSSDPKAWIQQTSSTLLSTLEALARSVPAGAGAPEGDEGEEDGEEEAASGRDEKDDASQLLAYLFDHGLLPTYAFPTDLCSFLVEERRRVGGRMKVVVKERPQQSIGKALSEYAPGRLIVIDKQVYRSGGVTASSLPTEHDRAARLFAERIRPYTYCKECAYVQDPDQGHESSECPVCEGALLTIDMLTPEVFSPEEGHALDETDRDQEFTYATAAQFPVPAGQDHFQGWTPVGTNGSVIHSADRRLVIVNKGKKGSDDGFQVCDKCGAAAPTGTGQATRATHQRPYIIDWGRGGQRPPPCDGAFRTAFLGSTFDSDLLLLRVYLRKPVHFNMKSSIARGVLEESLQTLSEALSLSASRHLSIDASEFSAGFRIIPGTEADERIADVYLFDTLAGGAGYSDQAGHAIEEILEKTRTVLATCPAGCDRSCYDCIRHYGNQHSHERLDRGLGLALLGYLWSGKLPRTTDLDAQASRFVGLARMLELDGYTCQRGIRIGELQVPLLVEGSRERLALGTYHGLLDRDADGFSHPLDALDARGEKMYLMNEYLLSRNLPGAYQLVRKRVKK